VYLKATMTEENLQHLSMDELYALMIRTIEEYLILHKHLGNIDELEIKRAELDIIQKVITARKAEKPAEK